MMKAAAILGLFAILGTTLVTSIYQITAERIAQNERRALLDSLYALIPAERVDNDMFADTLEVHDAELLGTPRPLIVYRARKAGRPVAVVLNVIAPDGYSGRISLLVGIFYDGTIAGVRAVSHKETPGLGDAIDVTRSDWVDGFVQKSLRNPDTSGWAVKKDGGQFDQFTGATITPRAVVRAVHNALIYYQAHRDALFAERGS